MFLCRIAPAFTLVASAVTAHAQTMSPGLWETTITMKTHGGETDAGMAKMQAEMAAMPPERRKMVEEMMAQRGIGIGMGAGKPSSVRVCISKERAERGDVPDTQDRNCQRENVERKGATLKFKLACSNPPATGEGEMTFSSEKSYDGKVLIDTQVKGKPARLELQQQGRWLGTDCGELKPR